MKWFLVVIAASLTLYPAIAYAMCFAACACDKYAYHRNTVCPVRWMTLPVTLSPQRDFIVITGIAKNCLLASAT